MVQSTLAYNKNVKTNIGAKFLSIIDKHFKNTNLEKYFNRQTIKVSYSCMPNLKTIITGQNKKNLSNYRESSKFISNSRCNCRTGPTTCPLNGNCLDHSMVYKAEVNVENGTKAVYIGASANTFKERYRNHISSFDHAKYQNNTGCSKITDSTSKASKSVILRPICMKF